MFERGPTVFGISARRSFPFQGQTDARDDLIPRALLARGVVDQRAVDEALSRLRNVLPEMMGLYKALDHIAPATELSVVYDYGGVDSWLSGNWKAKDPLVAEIVSTCIRTIDRKSLVLHYIHQPGHHSLYAGPNDLAFYNNMADSLAKRGVGTQAHIWK